MQMYPCMHMHTHEGTHIKARDVPCRCMLEGSEVASLAHDRGRAWRKDSTLRSSSGVLALAHRSQEHREVNFQEFCKLIIKHDHY